MIEKWTKEKLPLNPNTEIFRWGPVPMRIFYIADFLEGIFSNNFFRKDYPDYAWPNGLALSKNKRFVFVQEFPGLRRQGAKVFVELMLPVSVRNKIYKNWRKDLKSLEECESKISEYPLVTLSEKEFVKLWREFHLAVACFWRHVAVPELANYGSLEVLQSKLKPFTRDGVELSHAMEVLTAPTQLVLR